MIKRKIERELKKNDIALTEEPVDKQAVAISADKIVSGTISADIINFKPSGKWIAVTKGEYALAEPKKDHPTNCINCGAALHGNVCEYCGTEY